MDPCREVPNDGSKRFLAFKISAGANRPPHTSSGNNFNQAVKKLHTMDRVPEVKSWAEWNEKNKELFMQKAQEINQKIAQLVSQWWQE